MAFRKQGPSVTLCGLLRLHSDMTVVWTEAGLERSSLLFQKRRTAEKIDAIRFRKNTYFSNACVFFEVKSSTIKLTANHSFAH